LFCVLYTDRGSHYFVTPNAGGKLQIEPSPLRSHFVKATVQVRHYADGTIGLFYGPRCIGRDAADGALITTQGPSRMAHFTTAALIRGRSRIKARTKRTYDLLRKPDKLTCYGQPAHDGTYSGIDPKIVNSFPGTGRLNDLACFLRIEPP
jgi:hypothetical protein